MKFPKKKLKPNTPRKHWTSEEDATILQLVSQAEELKWNTIAEQLSEVLNSSNRSGKQCRERWHNHLDPGLNKSPWSAEEQHALFTHHKKYGNTWAHLGSILQGRSENAIKNQFYSSLRRQFKKWKGFEPNRNQLKKYDSILTSQLLSSLGKRLKLKIHRTEEPTEKTIDNMDPVDSFFQESDGTADHDFIDLHIIELSELT